MLCYVMIIAMEMRLSASHNWSSVTINCTNSRE